MADNEDATCCKRKCPHWRHKIWYFVFYTGMPALMVCCAFYGFAGPDPDNAWTSAIKYEKIGIPDADAEEKFCDIEDEETPEDAAALCDKAGVKLYEEDWSLYNNKEDAIAGVLTRDADGNMLT